MKFVGLFFCALALVACGGGGQSTTPTPAVAPHFSPGVMPSADQLCALLTAADWTAAGLTGAGQPTLNSDAPGDAYCVYAGTSGATGGLEFDVFVNASISDANSTYNTVKQDMRGFQLLNLPGATEAVISPQVDSTYGAILVRNGVLVFTISLPTSGQAANQLTQLANLVMGRSTGLE